MSPYLWSTRIRRPLLQTAMSALLVCILLAACTSIPASTQGSTTPNKYGGALTIVPSPYGLFQRNFNPFLNDNSSLSGTRGMIYETLLFFNRERGTDTPWLATGYRWSNQLKTLTFTLREGVSWTDGQPFTSDDVVFTFNLMRQHHDLDINSVWAFLESVTSDGKYGVVFQFKKPSTPELWYVGGQTYIVPKHIWQQVKDPSHETNPNPVGTGPFKLKTFDPGLYVLERNPDYWQPGKPSISLLRYPAYKSNASADLLLGQGSIDWTGLYTKDLKGAFLESDPQHNHYWFPPLNIVTLYLNLAKPPFDQLAVRQAISLAIDRQRLSTEGESSLEPPAHPTALVLPANQQYMDPTYNNLKFTTDSTRAIQILQAAGYTRDVDGIFVDRQGQRLAFTMNVVSGWTDWIKDCQIMAENLKNIGIDVTIKQSDVNTYLTALQTGDYDTAISWTANGPSPYFLYYGLLASENSAPIGSQASSNWERWIDPATDTLLRQYSESNDPLIQRQALSGLQKIMVEQLPAIPLVYGVSWYEYTTARFVGWPTETDNYAVPSPYTYPDSAVVALHLQLR